VFAVVRAYLVFFVTDPVDDALASVLRERLRARAGAWAWAGSPPGWFDDPAAEDPGKRTTGAYLRVEAGEAPDPDDVAAMWDWVLASSGEQMVTIEVQWREEPLGRVHAGRPDDGLEARVLGVA
jgi:hypothetical protein